MLACLEASPGMGCKRLRVGASPKPGAPPTSSRLPAGMPACVECRDTGGGRAGAHGPLGY
jgi:hypothetical protein